jgi:hypothetical protein
MPCAIPSSWVPRNGGRGERAKGRVHRNELGKRWNSIQRRDGVGPRSKTARIQSMAPSLQGAIQATLAQAPHDTMQLEAEAILPQGGMASDAPAESGKGSSAKRRLKHPGPTLTGGRLQGTPLGPFQVQNVMTAVRGVLELLVPCLGSFNIEMLEHKITRRAWASAHGNLESDGGVMSLFLHAPLQAGGDKPEVN